MCTGWGAGWLRRGARQLWRTTKLCAGLVQPAHLASVLALPTWRTPYVYTQLPTAVSAAVVKNTRHTTATVTTPSSLCVCVRVCVVGWWGVGGCALHPPPGSPHVAPRLRLSILCTICTPRLPALQGCRIPNAEPIPPHSPDRVAPTCARREVRKGLGPSPSSAGGGGVGEATNRKGSADTRLRPDTTQNTSSALPAHVAHACGRQPANSQGVGEDA